MFKDKIILASKSPRRRELIAMYFGNLAFYEGSLEEPEWDGVETPKAYLNQCVATKWANAQKGVRMLLTSEDERWGLLVGDTIVVLGQKVLGKPPTPAAAVGMLNELSGKTHVVRTGYRIALFQGDRVIADSETVVTESEVTFHRLRPAEIRAYVKTGNPMDKAGAYGFQDGALKFVSHVRGSYTNIIGLPIFDVVSTAEKIGFRA